MVLLLIVSDGTVIVLCYVGPVRLVLKPADKPAKAVLL